MKRIILLVTLCILVLLSACTTRSENPPGTTAGTSKEIENQTEPNAPIEKEIVNLTCWKPGTTWTGATEVNQMDSAIGKLIAEQTGVAFKTVYISGDSEQAFNLKLASGNWEDIIQCGTNFTWVEKLVNAGVIEPLDSYYSDTGKYPNLAGIPREIQDSFRYTDGKVYYFPNYWYEDMDSVYGYWCASGWYVHPEYLKAVNMTVDDLKTLEGIEKFLIAVRDGKLKTTDGQKVVAMTSSVNLGYRNTILTTFGVSLEKNGFDIQDGNIVNYRELPRTKEAFAWMNKLYRLGVMDPEFSTQTNEILNQKLMNRRVALIADEAWPFWTAVTGGKSPVTDLVYIPFPKAPGVDKLGTSLVYDPYGYGGWMMTKKCKDKEAIARAADWGSQTGQYRNWEAIYGPRGNLWDWDKTKGEPYFDIINTDLKAALKNGDYKKLEEIGYQMPPMVRPFNLDENYFYVESQESLFWIFGMHKFNATQGYHSKTRPIDKVIISGNGPWGQNSATINDLDKQYAAKMIVAKDDSSFNAVWEEYQQKLESMGKFSTIKQEFMKAYEEQIK